MPGMFNILSIEIDGHFHGSSDVPRPWVAAILGTDPKFGLRREFVRPMTDWANARRAWSGNIYGREARFLLRDGCLYEVCRLRGNSSKRHLAREFVAIEKRRRIALEPAEALARIDGLGECATFRIPEDKAGTSWVAHIVGLGTPERLGFVVVDDERFYRLRDGLYEVVESGERRLVGVRNMAVQRLSEREALSWLT
jgi:hypothetical protein